MYRSTRKFLACLASLALVILTLVSPAMSGSALASTISRAHAANLARVAIHRKPPPPRVPTRRLHEVARPASVLKIKVHHESPPKGSAKHEVTPAATPQPPFTQCPADGLDTSCGILIQITNSANNILGDPSQGPFDGSDDTLVGLLNNSSDTISSIQLSSNTNLLGFDGDGLCVQTPEPAACPFGPTTYEGPGVSYTNITPDQSGGVVNFSPGISPGQSGYFSLEEPLNATIVTAGGPTPGEQGGPVNLSENPTTCSVAKPVNCATGTFWHQFTDFAVPGRGVPLNFSRTYSSSQASVNGPLGYGWTDSYNMSLSTDASGDVTISQEDGSTVTFLPNGAGGFTAAPRVLATLTANADGSYTFVRDRGQTQYNFSAAGLLTSEVDRNGYTTQLGYNGSGQLTTVTDPSGRTLTFTYSGSHLAKVTDPSGRTWSYSYDTSGNLAHAADPMGRVWSFTYDPNHLLLAMTDPRGGVTTNTYNSSAQVTSQVDADGGTTTWSYAGDPTSTTGGTTTMTDPNGEVTTYQYSSLELTSVTHASDPSGRVTTYSYDAASQPTGITYSNGVTPNVSYSYDADGQRASMTDGTGTTSYSFDGAGHLTSVTNGAGATVSYGYDPAGYLTSLTYPNGNAVTRSYDGAGRLASVTDWLGNQTTFGYDRDGNLTSETYPNGVTATATFDNADQQVSITDRKGATSLASFSYARDNLGQVTSDTETGALAGKTTYTYNQLSQLASNNANPFAYDPAGNPTTLASGATQSFNAASEVTSAQRPAKAVAPATDQVVSANRTSHGTTLTAPAFATTTSGELVVAFISAAGPSTAKQKVTAVKGGGLQWTLVTRQDTQQGDAEVWQAQAAGPLTGATVTATLAASADGSITVASFTHARSVTGAHVIASGDSTNPAVVVTTTAADSLVWGTGEDATSAKKPTPAGGQILAHEYSDTASHATYWVQKTGAISASGTHLRLSDTTNKDHWNLAAVVITSDAGTKNTYGYDSQGNRVSITPSSGPATTLKYDQANRLISYGTIATYAYNGDGLRMSKTVSGGTIGFGWDQSGTLPLVIASGSTSYIYGPGNQPIEQVTGSTVTYLQADQQGSTRLLSSSTGAVVGTYSYTPYGTPTRHTGTVATPLQFDGQYTDYESGLQYLQARYYDRITAQFISQDPAVSLTAEPYSYTSDNPLNYSDPSGLLDSGDPFGTLFNVLDYAKAGLSTLAVPFVCITGGHCRAAVHRAYGDDKQALEDFLQGLLLRFPTLILPKLNLPGFGPPSSNTYADMMLPTASYANISYIAPPAEPLLCSYAPLTI